MKSDQGSLIERRASHKKDSIKGLSGIQLQNEVKKEIARLLVMGRYLKKDAKGGDVELLKDILKTHHIDPHMILSKRQDHFNNAVALLRELSERQKAQNGEVSSSTKNLVRQLQFVVDPARMCYVTINTSILPRSEKKNEIKAPPAPVQKNGQAHKPERNMIDTWYAAAVSAFNSDLKADLSEDDKMESLNIINRKICAVYNRVSKDAGGRSVKTSSPQFIAIMKEELGSGREDDAVLTGFRAVRHYELNGRS